MSYYKLAYRKAPAGCPLSAKRFVTALLYYNLL